MYISPLQMPCEPTAMIRRHSERGSPWPGLRIFVRTRLVNGRLQVFRRIPKSNVPMYALKRGKGVNP